MSNFLGSWFVESGSDGLDIAGDSTLSKLGDSLFSEKNIGSTLQGFGSVVGGIGSIFAQNKQADYQDKLFNMEEKRIADEKQRQKKFDRGMSSAFA